MWLGGDHDVPQDLSNTATACVHCGTLICTDKTGTLTIKLTSVSNTWSVDIKHSHEEITAFTCVCPVIWLC